MVVCVLIIACFIKLTACNPHLSTTFKVPIATTSFTTNVLPEKNNPVPDVKIYNSYTYNIPQKNTQTAAEVRQNLNNAFPRPMTNPPPPPPPPLLIRTDPYIPDKNAKNNYTNNRRSTTGLSESKGNIENSALSKVANVMLTPEYQNKIYSETFDSFRENMHKTIDSSLKTKSSRTTALENVKTGDVVPFNKMSNLITPQISTSTTAPLQPQDNIPDFLTCDLYKGQDKERVKNEASMPIGSAKYENQIVNRGKITENEKQTIIPNNINEILNQQSVLKNPNILKENQLLKSNQTLPKSDVNAITTNSNIEVKTDSALKLNYSSPSPSDGFLQTSKAPYYNNLNPFNQQLFFDSQISKDTELNKTNPSSKPRQEVKNNLPNNNNVVNSVSQMQPLIKTSIKPQEIPSDVAVPTFTNQRSQSYKEGDVPQSPRAPSHDKITSHLQLLPENQILKARSNYNSSLQLDKNNNFTVNNVVHRSDNQIQPLSTLSSNLHEQFSERKPEVSSQSLLQDKNSGNVTHIISTMPYLNNFNSQALNPQIIPSNILPNNSPQQIINNNIQQKNSSKSISPEIINQSTKNSHNKEENNLFQTLQKPYSTNLNKQFISANQLVKENQFTNLEPNNFLQLDTNSNIIRNDVNRNMPSETPSRVMGKEFMSQPEKGSLSQVCGAPYNINFNKFDLNSSASNQKLQDNKFVSVDPNSSLQRDINKDLLNNNIVNSSGQISPSAEPQGSSLDLHHPLSPRPTKIEEMKSQTSTESYNNYSDPFNSRKIITEINTSTPSPISSASSLPQLQINSTLVYQNITDKNVPFEPQKNFSVVVIPVSINQPELFPELNNTTSNNLLDRNEDLTSPLRELSAQFQDNLLEYHIDDSENMRTKNAIRTSTSNVETRNKGIHPPNENFFINEYQTYNNYFNPFNHKTINQQVNPFNQILKDDYESHVSRASNQQLFSSDENIFREDPANQVKNQNNLVMNIIIPNNDDDRNILNKITLTEISEEFSRANNNTSPKIIIGIDNKNEKPYSCCNATQESDKIITNTNIYIPCFSEESNVPKENISRIETKRSKAKENIPSIDLNDFSSSLADTILSALQSFLQSNASSINNCAENNSNIADKNNCLKTEIVLQPKLKCPKLKTNESLSKSRNKTKKSSKKTEHQCKRVVANEDVKKELKSEVTTCLEPNHHSNERTNVLSIENSSCSYNANTTSLSQILQMLVANNIEEINKTSNVGNQPPPASKFADRSKEENNEESTSPRDIFNVPNKAENNYETRKPTSKPSLSKITVNILPATQKNNLDNILVFV